MINVFISELLIVSRAITRCAGYTKTSVCTNSWRVERSVYLVIALETIKSSDMNTIIMNHDVHTPAFVKADASNKSDNIKQQPTSPKQVRRFSWTRFIELAILLSIVIGVIWLISKMVTPQVVTVVSVIAGFLILRFIVRVILKVTFTLLSILFWLAILCAILLCVL